MPLQSVLASGLQKIYNDCSWPPCSSSYCSCSSESFLSLLLSASPSLSLSLSASNGLNLPTTSDSVTTPTGLPSSSTTQARCTLIRHHLLHGLQQRILALTHHLEHPLCPLLLLATLWLLRLPLACRLSLPCHLQHVGLAQELQHGQHQQPDLLSVHAAEVSGGQRGHQREVVRVYHRQRCDVSGRRRRRAMHGPEASQCTVCTSQVTQTLRHRRATSQRLLRRRRRRSRSRSARGGGGRQRVIGVVDVALRRMVMEVLEARLRRREADRGQRLLDQRAELCRVLHEEADDVHLRQHVHRLLCMRRQRLDQPGRVEHQHAMHAVAQDLHHVRQPAARLVRPGVRRLLAHAQQTAHLHVEGSERMAGEVLRPLLLTGKRGQMQHGPVIHDGNEQVHQ